MNLIVAAAKTSWVAWRRNWIVFTVYTIAIVAMWSLTAAVYPLAVPLVMVFTQPMLYSLAFIAYKTGYVSWKDIGCEGRYGHACGVGLIQLIISALTIAGCSVLMLIPLFLGSELFIYGATALTLLVSFVIILNISQASWFAVDNSLNIKDALRRSKYLVKHNIPIFVLTYIALSLVMCAGVLALGVGVIIALPIVNLMEVYVHHSVRNKMFSQWIQTQRTTIGNQARLQDQALHDLAANQRLAEQQYKERELQKQQREQEKLAQLMAAQNEQMYGTPSTDSTQPIKKVSAPAPRPRKPRHLSAQIQDQLRRQQQH